MSEQPKLYIAGIGMITPVGSNTAMTAAMVQAGESAYAESEYTGQHNIPITMAAVPTAVFDDVEIELIEGDRYNERHDRILKLAIIAINEACGKCSVQKTIPLVLALPQEHTIKEDLSPLIPNLEQNCKPWLVARQCRTLTGGRSIGLEAVDYVFRHLDGLSNDYVLIGSSDSYQDYERLTPLIDEDRVLTPNSKNGFAPGEGACFLLLTRKPELAMQRNGFVVALNPPGIAEEPGHLGGEQPYRGDGLDQAFKKALANRPQAGIHSIYNSMNGENLWAKEYGVAYIRNKDAFADNVKIEHPADCYGDLGSATGTALIALAAESLYGHPQAMAHLVYSSSDTAKRGAMVIEKISYRESTASTGNHHYTEKE